MTWKKMIKYEGECWMWTGCKVDGYGNYRGGTAHRAVFSELRGPPPGNLVNQCGYRSCVNPDHWNAPSESDRFWAKVQKTDVCWLWVGGVDGHGYGAFRDSHGVQTLAHRKAWELTHGSYPDGMLLHRCDTPRCVRPDHMFIGDQADNIADAVSKGRHPHNEKHGSAKLTWTMVHDIRRMYAEGVSQGRIATLFGVSQMNISNIVRHKTWREN